MDNWRSYQSLESFKTKYTAATVKLVLGKLRNFIDSRSIIRDHKKPRLSVIEEIY